MHKLHYDAKTGKILGFYIEGLSTDIPTPNIDLTASEYAALSAKCDQYRIEKNGAITDISETADYLNAQAARQTARAKAVIREKIETLETSQARPLREIELADAGVGSEDDKAFAVKKLTRIQADIVALRAELAELETESEA